MSSQAVVNRWTVGCTNTQQSADIGLPVQALAVRTAEMECLDWTLRSDFLFLRNLRVLTPWPTIRKEGNVGQVSWQPLSFLLLGCQEEEFFSTVHLLFLYVWMDGKNSSFIFFHLAVHKKRLRETDRQRDERK